MVHTNCNAFATSIAPTLFKVGNEEWSLHERWRADCTVHSTVIHASHDRKCYSEGKEQLVDTTDNKYHVRVVQYCRGGKMIGTLERDKTRFDNGEASVNVFI